MAKKKIVVLSGAGISAESGLKTFRDSDGLWENHNVMDVASIAAWNKNPELVQKFYNDRRNQLQIVSPNKGHTGLVDLEKYFEVYIITQNVDNLHERAGSKNIIHLHGELTKVKGESFPSHIWELNSSNYEVKIGDLCPKGSQVRPHIVWFGEEVPEMESAVPIVASADCIVIVGTSLNVYPAANLVNYAQQGVPIYLIDPVQPSRISQGTIHICKGASEGIEVLKQILIEKYIGQF